MEHWSGWMMLSILHGICSTTGEQYRLIWYLGFFLRMIKYQLVALI